MLTDAQLDRYARHIILKDVGGAGQQKLLQSRVLVIGAGGLGSPALMYLAAAGVGTLGVIDDDVVSLSNLQRQVLHDTSAIGRQKTESAANRLKEINPDVTVEQHAMRLTAANALDLVSQYDLVADGSDNFETRFLVNDACYFAQRPLVSAAVGQFDGQLATYRGFEPDKPCYRCLFPAPPPPGTVPSCQEAGVLGALTGIMGSLQAIEVMKELLGVGESMAGRLLVYDALGATFRTIKIKPDPACPLCGEAPTIRSLTAETENG